MTLADYSIYCNELWIRIISELRLKNYAIIYEPGVNMVEQDPRLQGRAPGFRRGGVTG